MLSDTCLQTAKSVQVYHPCVLASKKRYVGFMYESPGQQEPAFDAKGIETVRRDSCPVVAKMLERSIRILFSTHDLSLVEPCLLPSILAAMTLQKSEVTPLNLNPSTSYARNFIASSCLFEDFTYHPT